MLRAFARKWGKRGRAVLRFEYRNWTRVLQTNNKHPWRSRRMAVERIYKRLYREDEKADENWTSIATKMPLERPVPPMPSDEREGLEREYLQAVLVPLQYYAVDTTRERMRDDGELERAPERRYFQVLGAQTGKSKERTMHTVQSADDICQRSGLILHILFLDRWRPPDEPADATIRVYTIDDDQWVRPSEVAEFNDMQNHMFHYRDAVADDDHPACTIISRERVAGPRFALTDIRIPTLTLAWHLRNNGWDPVCALMDHKEVPAENRRCNFDQRGGTSSKFYLMVLTKLLECLPFSGGHVPSQQPMAYYKCLMEGIKTEPGLRANQYVLMWNRSLKGEKRAKQLLPLEDKKPPVRDPDEFFCRASGCPGSRGAPCTSGPRPCAWRRQRPRGQRWRGRRPGPLAPHPT